MAKLKPIYTTEQDKHRILACLARIEILSNGRERTHIEELEHELGRARLISDVRKTPANVITMRSTVRLMNHCTGRPFECTLVYPEEADPEQRRISVLAPLGTAMFGCRVGDTFQARLPRGLTKYSVEALIYQPESAGDFHL